MSKSRLVILFLVIVSAALPIKTWAIDISSCNALDIEGATFNLTANISGDFESGTCFEILANNVTINGQGFTVTNTGNSSGATAFDAHYEGGPTNYDGTVIKNISVNNFETFFYGSGVTSGNIGGGSVNIQNSTTTAQIVTSGNTSLDDGRGGNGGNITVSSSTVGLINANGGSDSVSSAPSLDGYGGHVTINFSRVLGDISTLGGAGASGVMNGGDGAQGDPAVDEFSTGGPGGNGGDGEAGSDGANGGNVIINNSIVGAIDTRGGSGGNGYSGGYGGQGGDGFSGEFAYTDGGPGGSGGSGGNAGFSGTGGNITIFNSSYGAISRTGGSASGGAKGLGGAGGLPGCNGQDPQECGSSGASGADGSDGENNSGGTGSLTVDNDAPGISSVASTTGDTTATITWTTDIFSDSAVNYGLTSSYTATTTGNASTTSHTVNLTGLTQGTTYHFRVRSTGISGALAVSGDYTLTTTGAPADVTAPSISAGSPSGEQVAGTTGVTLQVTTDETATCKYDDTSGTSYASMSDEFDTTNGTNHSEPITGLTNGTSYNYYVRCIDGSTNANSSDYTISFSVASAPSGGGGGGGGGGSSRRNNNNTPSTVINSTNAPTQTRVLKIGDEGQDVVKLQLELIDKGFLVIPPGVGLGYYGNLTESAYLRSLGGVINTPSSAPLPEFYIGRTGPEVVNLQNTLINLGYLVIPQGVSKGYYGNLTQVAHRQYLSEGQPALPAIDTQNASGGLRLGNTGPAVSDLQTMLIAQGYLTMPAGVAKGYYGKLTEDAVVRFEIFNRIDPADGIADPLVLKLLRQN